MTGSPLLICYREPAGTKEVGEVEELMQNRKYMQSLHQEFTIFIQHLSESFNTLQGCWPHTSYVVTVRKETSLLLFKKDSMARNCIERINESKRVVSGLKARWQIGPLGCSAGSALYYT